MVLCHLSFELHEHLWMWNFMNTKLTDHEAGHVATKPDRIIVEKVFAPALTSINASLKMLASRQLRLSIYVKDPISTSFGRLAGQNCSQGGVCNFNWQNSCNIMYTCEITVPSVGRGGSSTFGKSTGVSSDAPLKSLIYAASKKLKIHHE